MYVINIRRHQQVIFLIKINFINISSCSTCVHLHFLFQSNSWVDSKMITQHVRLINTLERMRTYLWTIAVFPCPVQITSIAFIGKLECKRLILASKRVKMSFSSEVTLYLMPFFWVELLSHVSNDIISASFPFKLSTSSACFLKYEFNSEKWAQTKCTLSFATYFTARKERKYKHVACP